MGLNLKINEKPYATALSAVTDTGAYRPVSYWQETIELQPGDPLESDTACDVAIVGGGFTGLSTAYELKRSCPELDIVVLERGVAGHGASGRNGGFSMPLFGWDLLDTVKQRGEEEAGRVYRMMYNAVDHLRDIIERENISCDAEYTGYIMLATCASRERRMRKELDVAHRLGFEHEWLEGDSLDAHIRCDAFRAGLFDPKPFVINPAKLTQGLKDSVERLGVRIYEQTPLLQLTEGAPNTLRTPGGTVSAKRVMLALNGYGTALGFQSSTLLPVHTYIVLTEPLSDAQLASTGWNTHRASLETARNLIHYFRLTVDNRIVFGGEDADLYYGGAFRDHDEKIYEALEGTFRQFFPTLDRVNMTHRWGGTLGVAIDMFPTFGATGEKQRIFYASGYAGHGVSLANYAGCMMAPKILKSLNLAGNPLESNPFFYNRSPFKFPPDPLRYVGMKVYRMALRAQDRIAGA